MDGEKIGKTPKFHSKLCWNHQIELHSLIPSWLMSDSSRSHLTFYFFFLFFSPHPVVSTSSTRQDSLPPTPEESQTLHREAFFLAQTHPNVASSAFVRLSYTFGVDLSDQRCSGWHEVQSYLPLFAAAVLEIFFPSHFVTIVTNDSLIAESHR